MLDLDLEPVKAKVVVDRYSDKYFGITELIQEVEYLRRLRPTLVERLLLAASALCFLSASFLAGYVTGRYLNL